MKTFKYVVIYLLAIQLILPYIIPLELVYQERLDYNLVKDNMESLDIALEGISHQIKSENLQDYVVILGDSIAFSGPGPSQASIGHYLQELADDSTAPARVFNLSMPAMQMGDIYLLLLKLDHYGISSDNLILNVDYKGFTERQPGPPIVFWLQDDLKYLDADSLDLVRQNLQANHKLPSSDLSASIHRFLWNYAEMFRYSAMIRKGLQHLAGSALGAAPGDDSIGDARAWNQKPGLRQILEREEYQQEFNPAPFDMNKDNLQVFFLDKLVAHQQGKHTLIWLAGANQELMRPEVSNPGYLDNMERIDRYLAGQPVSYVNANGKIQDALFSDHLHLTAAGYQELARLLWENFNQGDRS